MNIFWFFLFFLISGFCSLVYEVVWLRLAMAKFGVTTPMVSIVLSVFMAGLALGSWLGGALARTSERRGPRAPLRLYGLAELLIGVSGLLVPRLLQFGYDVLQKSGRELAWDSSFYYLVSGSCVVVTLLPWCTCIGATFPFGMAAIRRISSADASRSFSFLYLANVLGAILGTLIPAFILIELLGFQSTLHVAASLNGILACLVFALSFALPSSEAPAAVPTAVTMPHDKLYEFSAGGTLWLLFITGLSTMAMEVVWIRLFTVYLGNVVYSFAAILALYLAATFAGSCLYRVWARSHDSRRSAGAWVFLGLLSLLPLLFADPFLRIPPGVFWKILRTAQGIAPFSAALGFLTPLLVDHYSKGNPSRAGRAYAVNIVGGILGPLLAGFWFLPWLGDHWALVVLSVPLFGVGLFAALRISQDAATGSSVFGSKPIYAAVMLLSITLIATSKGYEAAYRNRVELRDYTATVLAAGDGMRKMLLVNGIGMTVLTPITKYMAHFPLTSLGRPPQNALVICFGMGTTFRSMLSWGIDSTAVELIPSVPEVFGFFHPDGPALLKSPLAHIVVDDGRRFLERTGQTFDVITLDPPPPVSTPTTSLLYSREFYGIVKKRLRPGGILQVWLAIHDPGSDPTTQAAAAKALRDSFPYIRAFSSLNHFGLHFLASDQPILVPDAHTLASRLPPAAAADFVEWGPAHSSEEMFAEVLNAEMSIDKVTAADPRVPPIQDDRPINEYFFLRRLFAFYP